MIGQTTEQRATEDRTDDRTQGRQLSGQTTNTRAADAILHPKLLLEREFLKNGQIFPEIAISVHPVKDVQL